MTAVVDCIQFLPGGMVRWVLIHHKSALMAEAEWSWTRVADDATPLPVEKAEALKRDPSPLPWLPTEPPCPCAPLRVCYGGKPTPELPRMTIAPEMLAERQQRREDRIAQAEATVPKTVAERTQIAKAGAKTRAARQRAADEVYRQTCERLGERES